MGDDLNTQIERYRTALQVIEGKIEDIALKKNQLLDSHAAAATNRRDEAVAHAADLEVASMIVRVCDDEKL